MAQPLQTSHSKGSRGAKQKPETRLFQEMFQRCSTLFVTVLTYIKGCVCSLSVHMGIGTGIHVRAPTYPPPTHTHTHLFKGPSSWLLIGIGFINFSLCRTVTVANASSLLFLQHKPSFHPGNFMFDIHNTLSLL